MYGCVSCSYCFVTAGIVFTSGTAVEVCVSSLTEHERGKVAELWEQLPVFVVGKATAQAGKCFMSCEPIENLPIIIMF